MHITNTEWLTCDSPLDMLKYLEGKVYDEAFMRFSVACCRRIWTLLSDRRSRAVVETTEDYLAGNMTAEVAGQVYAHWERTYKEGEVHDLAGGSTNEAIESVCGVGYGHAAQVCAACLEAAGYAASEPLRVAGALQPQITEVRRTAQSAEKVEQCKLLRDLFGCRPEGVLRA